MFQSLFSSLARFKYLCLFLFVLIFILWSAGTAKFTIRQVLSFLSIVISGCEAEIRWSVCISKSPRILCVSFSRTDPGLCMYHLRVSTNFNFLENSQWIPFSTKLCLVLYSFSANLLHSLIMWFIVSSRHHLIYICYSFVSYLISLQRNWSLWRCFVLLLK